MKLERVKLPKGLVLSCGRHGGNLKYHDGDYYCVDEFDGSSCTMISVYKKQNTKEAERQL